MPRFALAAAAVTIGVLAAAGPVQANHHACPVVTTIPNSNHQDPGIVVRGPDAGADPDLDLVSRALLIVAVTALLVLPMLSARERPEPDRQATADAICLDHYGVRSTTRKLVTCADGALHRWNGEHVRHRVPVLNGAVGSR